MRWCFHKIARQEYQGNQIGHRPRFPERDAQIPTRSYAMRETEDDKGQKHQRGPEESPRSKREAALPHLPDGPRDRDEHDIELERADDERIVDKKQ